MTRQEAVCATLAMILFLVALLFAADHNAVAALSGLGSLVSFDRMFR